MGNSNGFFYNQTFRAYARCHTGEVHASSGKSVADIIHISPYDARLRLQDESRYDLGSVLELHVQPKLDATPCMRHSIAAKASVNWIHGNELGLLFPMPLELGTKELQELLD